MQSQLLPGARSTRTAAKQSIWVFALLGLLAVRPVLAHSSRGDCYIGNAHILAKVRVAAPPFEAVPSENGCWIFASLIRASPRHGMGDRAGVAVLRLRGKGITAERFVPLSPPDPLGLVLTHDGKLLIVADARYVYFLDTERLVEDKRDPVLGSIRDTDNPAAICRGAQCPGSAYVVVTPDDQTLFVSDEGSAQVSIINLRKARRTGFHENAIVGTIPTGWAPVGLAVSSNGRYLYVTSEVSRARTSPVMCRPEIPAEPLHPEGTVQVVSVAQALSDPPRAVIASVPAGCTPVRAVLSPDDRRLYVTLRGDNALSTFDTSKLLHDPERALLSKILVGTAPVGVATVDHGRQIVVANTDRFGDGGGNLTVIEASGIGAASGPEEWTIETEKGPWELHSEPDGNALLITDSRSDEIELIGVNRLREHSSSAKEAGRNVQ